VDRRQRAEPRKYLRAANIPGMDDGIAAGKRRERQGGKNWQHAAFNPETGLFYANTFQEGRMYKHLDLEEILLLQIPLRRAHRLRAIILASPTKKLR
jgi:hypothetical protein